MAFAAVWPVLGGLWELIQFGAHFLSRWGLFLIKRLIFCLMLGFLLYISENQVVIMEAAGQVSESISNIMPDFSFINDVLDCIDGFRLLWNTGIDVAQAFFFVISAAIGKPITSFERETHFAGFNAMYMVDDPELMAAREQRDIIFTPRSLVDFCSYFIPMRDLMIDVVNIVFGGLREILNTLFDVFPNFPDLRRRVKIGAYRVYDASGVFMDERFNVIDALIVFITAIMQAFMDVFDNRNCFHPINEFPATFWGCLGCGFNRTQAAASTTTKINAPIVCVCGGSLNDNTVVLVIQCIGLAPLLSIYENVLRKKDEFLANMGVFEDIKNAAIALWNFVQGLYNKARDDVDTIVDRFCGLDPTGIVCEVLGLRDGEIICAYDRRLLSENDPAQGTLLFCYDKNMPRMSPMPLNITTMGRKLPVLFSTQTYLAPLPAIPINPSFIHDDDDLSPRYTFRDVVEMRPNWVDQTASIANAMIDTAFETVMRGESPGVDYIVNALTRHNFEPLAAREGVRDLVRRVGAKPRITQVEYPDMQERVVVFFGVAIAFTTLFVGLSTILLPAFLPCIITTLLSLMLVMLIVLPALAELAGNTVSNFVAGGITVYDPFSFLINTAKDTYLEGFTRAWTPAEIGTLFSTLASGASKTLDMCAIYIFKSGLNVFLAIFGNGNGLPSPLFDTNTGEPIDSFLSYFNSLLNCKPTDQCYAASDCFNGGCNCVNGTLARGQSRCNEKGTCYCAPRLRKGTFNMPQFSIVFKGIDPTVFGYVVNGIVWPIESDWWLLPFRWIRSFVYGFLPFLFRVLVYNLHLGSLGIIMPCCSCICKCCKRQIGWSTKLSYIGVPLGIGLGLLVDPTVDYCEFRSSFFCRPVKHFLLPRNVQSVEYVLALFNLPASFLGAYCLYLLIVLIQAFLMTKLIAYVLKFLWIVVKEAFRAPSMYIVARKSHGNLRPPFSIG